MRSPPHRGIDGLHSACAVALLLLALSSLVLAEAGRAHVHHRRRTAQPGVYTSLEWNDSFCMGAPDRTIEQPLGCDALGVLTACFNGSVTKTMFSGPGCTGDQRVVYDNNECISAADGGPSSTLVCGSYKGATNKGATNRGTVSTSSSPPSFDGFDMSAAAAVDTSFVSVTDPNWFFSPYNWNLQPSATSVHWTKEASAPGAYFKLSFSGSAFTMMINGTNAPPVVDYMNLRWTVDDLPYQTAALPSGVSWDFPGSTQGTLVLAKGLNASATHTIVLFVLNSDGAHVDRWATPANIVRISGALVDDGAVLSPYPFLYKKNMLIYWDSIGEGCHTNGNANYSDLTDNDSMRNWVQVLALSLQAEVGIVAYGGQGYISAGSAHALMDLTHDNDAQHAWSHYDVHTSRLDAKGLLQPPPDLVLSGHGTNDWSFAPSDVTASVTAWLQAITRAAGAQAQVFVVLPFGPFQHGAIKQGYDAYQQQFSLATPTRAASAASASASAGDPRAHLLDLTPWHAGMGLGDAPHFPGSAISTDGGHPLAWRAAQIGGFLTAAVQQAMFDAKIKQVMQHEQQAD